MKKLIYTAAIILGCFAIKPANAQVRVSLGLNIASQPDWGPVGYDHADYYYMPDIDTYYDVTNHAYVYNEGGAWVHRTNLPGRYQSYDRYHGYKVVVNERNPWERGAEMRNRYAEYRGRRDQAIIRESTEARYRNHYREQVVRNRYHAEQNAYHARQDNAIARRNNVIARHNRNVQYHNVRTAHRIHRDEHRERHD